MSQLLPDEDFKYDIAFSFTKEDEALATRLNARIRGRVATFIYSEHQKELAGRNGEDVFNRVFGREARVVVVLFRSAWGNTPWTRIEETAIRNRGFEQGYDFVILIPVEAGIAASKWLPKNRIWIGLDRWGEEVAAGVLEARVQEAGGIPEQETVEARATRLKHELDLAAQREAFLHSQAGVDAAKTELSELFAEIERVCIAVRDEKTGVTFEIRQEARNCAIYSHQHTVTIAFSLQWGNTLEQSSLYISLWQGGVDVRGRRFSGFDEPRELRKMDFDVDYRPAEKRIGWRQNRKDATFLSTEALAGFCVDLLLDRIRKARLR